MIKYNLHVLLPFAMSVTVFRPLWCAGEDYAGLQPILDTGTNNMQLTCSPGDTYLSDTQEKLKNKYGNDYFTYNCLPQGLVRVSKISKCNDYKFKIESDQGLYNPFLGKCRIRVCTVTT